MDGQLVMITDRQTNLLSCFAPKNLYTRRVYVKLCRVIPRSNVKRDICEEVWRFTTIGTISIFSLSIHYNGYTHLQYICISTKHSSIRAENLATVKPDTYHGVYVTDTWVAVSYRNAQMPKIIIIKHKKFRSYYPFM